jgi:hypothetical protein
LILIGLVELRRGATFAHTSLWWYPWSVGWK